MPNVKIELLKNETPEQAEELLFKAISSQMNGELHGEEFNDPAMRDLINHMEREFKTMHTELVQELSRVLEEEHSNGNI